MLEGMGMYFNEAPELYPPVPPHFPICGDWPPITTSTTPMPIKPSTPLRSSGTLSEADTHSLVYGSTHDSVDGLNRHNSTGSRPQCRSCNDIGTGFIRVEGRCLLLYLINE